MNPTKLDVTKLDQQAAELGYSYRRGIKPGVGYNLVDDFSGDMPLGDDYTASLKAVKEYLDGEIHGSCCRSPAPWEIDSAALIASPVGCKYCKLALRLVSVE